MNATLMFVHYKNKHVKKTCRNVQKLKCKTGFTSGYMLELFLGYFLFAAVFLLVGWQPQSDGNTPGSRSTYLLQMAGATIHLG